MFTYFKTIRPASSLFSRFGSAVLFRLIIVLAIGLILQSAHARLGEDAKSVEVDRIQLYARTHSQKANPLYTVHELPSATGTLREYENAQGVIFAVAWQGIKRPDLSRLFGNYYTEYQNLDSARPRMLSRHAVTVKTANIVVNKSGHMRDLRGQAYLPSQVPNGVQVEALQ